MAVNLELQEALEHNRTLEVDMERGGKIVGCHSLDCMLQGITKGLVLQRIARLPGDGLPRGVYEVRLSCRKDQPAPNRRPPAEEDCPRHSKPLQAQKHSRQNKKQSGRVRDAPPDSPACNESTVFEFLDFDKLKEKSDESKNGKKRVKKGASGIKPTVMRQADAKSDKCDMIDGIKLMSKPTIKTVFNPAIWDDEKLKEKCEEAFQYYLKGDDHVEVVEDESTNTVKWQGQFNFEGANYWIEGVFTKEGDDSRVMKTFYFHPRKH